jgi:zinc transport system substrate-binding protein
VGIQATIATYLFVFLVILGPGSVSGGEPEASRKVVASIKPLTLITEAIVQGGNVRVDTLLPPGSSPHNYALKISDARRLQSADLVVWLGEDAEPHINPGKIKNNLALLSAVKQDELIKDSAAHGDHHHLVDPHIWLDPGLAQEMARLVAERLVALYPDQQALFQKNLADFVERSRGLDQKLGEVLVSYKGTGFLSYHNAYAYFVRRYGLKQLGAIQEQVGSTMSVKHLASLQAMLQPGETICLFREPQFAMASLPDLGDGRRLKTGNLDPLGTEAETYEQLLEDLANQLVGCFNEDSSRPAGKKKPD